MPYEYVQNEDEYFSSSAFIMSLIQDNPFTCIYAVGDLNAHVSANNSFFGIHLVRFCTDSGLVLSIKVLLPIAVLFIFVRPST